VECLPEDGTAVLNADDPYVLAMGDRTRARVVTYGISREAVVRGSEVRSNWPERLSLSVRHQGEQIRVHTQLVGEHWASTVLAALAASVACGIPLRRAVAVIESTRPVDGRLSPVEIPGGVTFMRDDWKASLWTVPVALRVLETAQAARKIAIIGTLSDYPGASSRKYRDIATQALAVADTAIFVGPNSHRVDKVRSRLGGERLLVFDWVCELDRFLQDYLRPGDLVLVKGSGASDHLERLVLSRTGDIACWRERCGRMKFCSACELRHDTFVPSEMPDAANLSEGIA
jgi:UDP-N-acetylmuramyl pentapeptide synthase